MPPFILYPLLVLIFGGNGALVLRTIRKVFKKKPGLHYTILGPNGSGKTALYNILTTGKGGKCSETVSAKPIQEAEISYKGKTIHLHKAVDDSGHFTEQAKRLRELEHKNNNDVIIYMVNLKEFFIHEKTKKEVRDELDTIATIVNQEKDTTLVLVVANFKRDSFHNNAGTKTIKKYLEDSMKGHDKAQSMLRFFVAGDILDATASIVNDSFIDEIKDIIFDKIL